MPSGWDVRHGIGRMKPVARRKSENFAPSGAVSFWYYNKTSLLAVDAANDPRAYMIGKRLIEAEKSPAPQVIEDPKTDLKALLKP